MHSYIGDAVGSHHSIPVHAKTTPVSSAAVVTHPGQSRVLLRRAEKLAQLGGILKPPQTTRQTRLEASLVGAATENGCL